MIIKKRQLLLATLIIALGAAVFINWYYTKPTAKSAGTKPEQTTQQAEQGANLGDARYVLSSDVTLDDARLRRRPRSILRAQSCAGRPPMTKPPSIRRYHQEFVLLVRSGQGRRIGAEGADRRIDQGERH